MNRSIDKARSTEYEEVRIGITSRQRQVARMKGSNTYDEIADELGISDRTAEKHYQNASNTVNKYPDYLQTMLDDIVELHDEATFRQILRQVEHYSADFDIDVQIEE